MVSLRPRAPRRMKCRAPRSGAWRDCRPPKRQLSGSFGIDGPVGSSPGSVTSGLLSFGLEGIKTKANETRAALEELGNRCTPTSTPAQSSAPCRRRAPSTPNYNRLARIAAAATRRVDQNLRRPFRSAYTDYGMEESG